MPVAIFCPVFVLQKINTKRSPSATKLFGDFLLDKINTRSFGRGLEDEGVGHEAPGCAPGGWHALVPREAHPAPFDLILPL